MACDGPSNTVLPPCRMLKLGLKDLGIQRRSCSWQEQSVFQRSSQSLVRYCLVCSRCKSYQIVKSQTDRDQERKREYVAAADMTPVRLSGVVQKVCLRIIPLSVGLDRVMYLNCKLTVIKNNIISCSTKEALEGVLHPHSLQFLTSH